jgi:hypothetical protein
MASVLIFNEAFFRQVLTRDARRIVEDRTRAVATGAQASAGKVGGRPPRFFTDFAVVQSGRRYRGAVVCISRNEKLQKAGQDALVARLRASA